MGTVAFKPLTDVENAFKQIVWVPMVKAGEMWLEGAVPFFALPVVSTLEEDAVNALADALFEFLRLQIDMTAIKLVNVERQALWSSINEKLTLIAKEQGVTSDAYQKALAKNAADFSNFIHTGP